MVNGERKLARKKQEQDMIEPADIINAYKKASSNLFVAVGGKGQRRDSFHHSNV
jgi:hypothetical protein